MNSFGIVDRDKLMADDNWVLLRELDDAKFEAGRPYQHIKITRRWELESYLVDPEVFEQYLSTFEGGRKLRSKSEVETEILIHADALVPLAAVNQTLHKHRIKAVGDGFTRLEDRGTVDSRIREEKLVGQPHLIEEYQAILPSIDAFGVSHDNHVSKKLDGLLRILNGKALLARLALASKIKDPFEYFLAKEIKQADRVAPELVEFVNQCIA